MKRFIKIMLVIFLSFVLLCGAFICFLLAVNDWNFDRVINDKAETVTYDIGESFSSVSIDSETENIQLIKSGNGKCRVLCDESEKTKFTVTVTEGCLSIQRHNSNKWYDNISLFSFGNRSVKVYLPENNYNSLKINEDTGNVTVPSDFVFGEIDITSSTGNVDCGASSSGRIGIKTSTGDICLKKLSAKDIDLSVSTGCVALTSVSCSSFNSTGDTGNISFSDSVVKEKITVERSTGDISFKHSDASEIEITTDTGDVTGTLLTDKVFIVRSDTGEIDVPETVTGGKCKVTTNTGDIVIKVEDNRVPSTDLPDESETAIEENLFTSTKPEL